MGHVIRSRGDSDLIGQTGACSKKPDQSDTKKPRTCVAWIGREAGPEHESLRGIEIKDKLGR